MENLLSFITENSLVLIPVLIIIGSMMKGTNKISDKYIPILLLPIGIVFSIGLMGIGINSIIQGVLVTGAAVYANQTFKQLNKSE